MLWLVAILLAVVLVVMFVRASQLQLPKGENIILHPHKPVIGMMATLSENVDNFPFWVAEVATKNGDRPWGGAVPGLSFVVITSAEAVEYVLKTAFDNFVKGPRFLANFDEFLGKGIFVVDGEEWKTQRKIASHLFKTKTLKTAMEESFLSHGKAFVKILERKAQTGETFDIQELLVRYTFDTICEIGFGFHLDALNTEGKSEAMHAFDRAQTITAYRFRTPPVIWKLQRFFSLGFEGELKGHIRKLNKLFTEIVQTRLEQVMKDVDQRSQDDFLTLFIKSELSKGRQPSVTFLRDIVASFLIAGRDTTASTLTSMIKMLGENPDADHKLCQEIHEELMPTDEAYPSFDLLVKKGGKYLDGVVNEVLRLQPPVPIDNKLCLESCVLPDGTPVEAGTCVFYCPYFMGRKESYWGPDVLRFKPERWLTRTPTPYEHPVFNAGPRICLGIRMANFEVKLLATMMLRQFKFNLAPKQTFTPLGGAVTLYQDGVKVTVVKRQK